MGLFDFQTVYAAQWLEVQKPLLPYGGLKWGLDLYGPVHRHYLLFRNCGGALPNRPRLPVHESAGCRVLEWRIHGGAVSNDGLGSALSALFGGMALTSYSQNTGRHFC